MQVDGLNQLPDEKRPPDLIIWAGTPEQIDEWLEKVNNPRREKDSTFIISAKDIEG